MPAFIAAEDFDDLVVRVVPRYAIRIQVADEVHGEFELSERYCQVDGNWAPLGVQ